MGKAFAPMIPVKSKLLVTCTIALTLLSTTSRAAGPGVPIAPPQNRLVVYEDGSSVDISVQPFQFDASKRCNLLADLALQAQLIDPGTGLYDIPDLKLYWRFPASDQTALPSEVITIPASISGGHTEQARVYVRTGTTTVNCPSIAGTIALWIGLGASSNKTKACCVYTVLPGQTTPFWIKDCALGGPGK